MPVNYVSKFNIDDKELIVKDSEARNTANTASTNATNALNRVDEYKELLLYKINELNKRISTIIADGQQTEGNTELIDIRTGADGKVYPTAGDAVRVQIGALSEGNAELKEDIGNRNITLNFNYEGYIDARGELNTSVTSFKTTDFIAVTESVIAVGVFANLDSPNSYIHCYDFDKKYLGSVINAISSGYKIVNVNGAVTLIDDTCFIRVTNHISMLDKIKMKYSLSDTGDLSSVNQKINETNKKIDETNKKIDKPITLNFNYEGYIDARGELNTSVTSFKTTDFIAVTESVIAVGVFANLDSPNSYIHCYDFDKKYLGSVINAISSGYKIVNVNGAVTLIDDTCFIRVTNHISMLDKIKMKYSLSDTGDLSSVNQKIEELKTNKSIYSSINDGLGFSAFSKFASVGDSLSVGYHTEKDGTAISKDLNHSWGAYIEKRCGTKSFWTGASGQTCKTWLNTASDTWGLNYCKSIGSMPLYVICMGANESNINIGTTEDIDTDNDTLYAYVSKVINELRKISPKSYIVCTGVSRKQNSIGINNVYKTICELKEKCYYLDCFKEFNSEPFTSYYFNFHYSANGYSVMANLFDYKLKEVMAKNVEDFKYINEAEK